jgi:hypothetical protein
MSPKVGLPHNEEIGEIFDEVFAEMLEEERKRERRGESPQARKPLSPELEQAGEALKAIFEGGDASTATTSRRSKLLKQIESEHRQATLTSKRCSPGTSAGAA